jgi:hypothetical protein
MLGSFLGSSGKVCELGEYMAYFAINDFLSKAYSDSRSASRKELIAFLTQQSHEFAKKKCKEQDAVAYIDDTPLNFHVISALEELEPSPLYVCIFRDAGGVVRSLEKAYLSGKKWAGAAEMDRIKLWSEFYNNITFLPDDRMCGISYGDFISDPNAAIAQLNEFFLKFNLDVSDAQKDTLTSNHATGQSGNKFTLHDGRLLASAAQLELIRNEQEYTSELRQNYPATIEDTYARLQLKGFRNE